MQAPVSQAVADVGMLDELEYTQVVHTFNDVDTDYPDTMSVVSVFEAQVAQQPDRVALVMGGEQISYGQLNARANQLAHYLIAQGVTRDTLVALSMEPRGRWVRQPVWMILMR